MNANKLADELENTYPFVGVMEIAATMLRQQQAEIEALKAGKIRAYDNGVEDGRKPDTNNKPVVWMSEVEGGTMYTNYEYPESIPLYTQQRPHNTVLVPCDKLAEMQAEIEALKKHNEELQKACVDSLVWVMGNGVYCSLDIEVILKNVLGSEWEDYK